jgi:hypothetical protein
MGPCDQAPPEPLDHLSTSIVIITSQHLPKVLHSLHHQEGPGQHQLLEARLARDRNQIASQQDGPTPWRICNGLIHSVPRV